MSRIRDIANILSGVSTDMATDAEVTSSIASHAAAADPHAVYLKESSFVASGKNFLINGMFDVWQRSTDTTSSASNGTFYAAADRWQNWVGTSCNTRYQRISDSNPGQYCYRIQRVQGVNVSTNYQLSQNIETSMSKLLVNKTVTLSFRVKKGADWSDADGIMRASVVYNDNTDGNAINQARTEAFGLSFSPTTSYATYSVTGTIPGANVSTVMVNFYWEPTGTAGANDWLEFAAVQLEIGDQTSSFSRAGGSIQGEIAACQRYYEKSFDIDVAPANGSTSTSFASTNGLYYAYTAGATGNESHYIKFSVPKRGTPSISYFGNNSGLWLNPSDTAIPAMSTRHIGQSGFATYQTLVTSYNTSRGHWVASAEL